MKYDQFPHKLFLHLKNNENPYDWTRSDSCQVLKALHCITLMKIVQREQWDLSGTSQKSEIYRGVLKKVLTLW
jgi:hypothetical protein